MGMAASQARYLALVARKTNCEYEGQQINQARTALANQSANLFNQMLGLSVPVPPSTQDFTTLQYSFTDGINGSVIDKWEQLAIPDEDGYNYVVQYHYNANVYHGFNKKMNDPQIQFSYNVPLSTEDQSAQIAKIQQALEDINTAQDTYDASVAEYNQLKTRASKLSTYVDRGTMAGVSSVTHPTTSPDTYTVTNAGGTHTYVKYDNTDATLYPSGTGKTQEDWKDMWEAELGTTLDENSLYVDITNGEFVFLSDIKNLSGAGAGGTSTILPVYNMDGRTLPTETDYSIEEMNTELSAKETAVATNLAALQAAQLVYDELNVPTFVGNNKLTPLSEISDEQLAEIKQIIRDSDANGGTPDLSRCFSSASFDTIKASDYTGGIYSFVQNGVTYYTTYYDLAQTAIDSEGINTIDQQPKLAYYHANYVEEPINMTERALLETDPNGRFSTVRFKDGSKYTLIVEEITDDDAYQDAMNAWTYKSARYDKMVQDINAKTSIIQAEDRQLELRLKQLDTEQSALSSEIDAVSKVLKDNIDKSFKTFGG